MKRMYRRLLWSLAALLGLVGVFLTWLFTADLDTFKPQLEQFISTQINRELSINGELDIHLGKTLEIRAENIVLENANWAEVPAMVDIGRLAARVDLWSVVSQPIVIHLIDLDDVTINLEQSAADDKNWEFELAGGTDKPAVEKEPLELWLETLEVNSVHIVYENAHRPEPVDISIQSLRQFHRDDDMLESSLDAAVNGHAIELQGVWGTWTSLLAGRDISFDMDGHLGGIDILAKGLIDDLRMPSRPEFEFSLDGPRIELVSEMLGLGKVGDGDINLSGSLVSENDAPLTLSVKGNLGQTIVDVTGSSEAIDNLDNISVVAAASGPSLGRILSYFGVDQVGDAPFDIALDLRRAGTVLSVDNTHVTFGGSRLDTQGELPNFPTLKHATVRIEIVGPRIEHLRHLLDIPGFATGPFYVGLDVSTDESGTPRLETTLQSELGRIVAGGVIGDPPNYVGSSIDFEFDAPSLLKLGHIAGIDNLPDQSVTARGSVERHEDRLDLQGPVRIETESIAASISGALHTSPRLLGTAVDIRVDGADLHDTLRRFHIDAGLPPLAYTASGTVRLGAEGIDLQGVSVALGTSAIELEGMISNARSFSGSHVKFNASGPSMDELFSGLDDVEIKPGTFETSATIRLAQSELHVENFELSREQGQVKMDAEIGLPLATKRLVLDLDASGPDVRSLFSDLGGFEPGSAPFQVDAQAERDGDEWSFRPLRVSLGGASAEARGQLTLAAESVSGRLTIEADVPNLAAVGRFRERQFAPQPLHLSGTLNGDKDRIVIDDLSANLNNSDIAGQLSYRFGSIPNVELDLKSAALTILPLFEESPNEQEEEPADSDGRIIPATPIPYELLRRVNATFDIEIGELQRGDFRANNIDVHGTVREGTLTVDDFRLDTRGGTIKTDGTLVAQETGGYTRIRLAADSVAVTNSPDHPVRANVDIDILSTGSDMRELAASSNGFFVLHATEGQIGKNPVLEMLFGGFASELLSVINPFEKSVDTTTLDCAVLAVSVTDGVVRGTPAVYFQSNAVRVVSDATIDLETEKLKLAFETLPGKGLKLMSIGEMVNPYFSVTGTFSEPRIKLDEKSALIAGGAAAATAGLSILAKGLFDRLKSSGDSCQRAAVYAEKFREEATNQDNP